MKEQYVKAIHKVIHENFTAVKINNEQYPVEVAPQSGCRFVTYNGLKFVEQNKANKNSYAKMAKTKKVTWVIPPGRGRAWGLIIDGQIEKPIPEV